MSLSFRFYSLYDKIYWRDVLAKRAKARRKTAEVREWMARPSSLWRGPFPSGEMARLFDEGTPGKNL
jgi:hypothetical protein